MNRFDYVKYDEEAITDQGVAQGAVNQLEYIIDSRISCPRSKALALTKLEECYMWIGKGIRNDLIKRNEAVTPFTPVELQK